MHIDSRKDFSGILVTIFSIKFINILADPANDVLPYTPFLGNLFFLANLFNK